jgi:hypothetical protein
MINLWAVAPKGTNSRISDLYSVQQGNPELLTKSYETAHNRLQVEGLVDT